MFRVMPSVLIVAWYAAPSFGSFFANIVKSRIATSLQVRGISSSMFFLSFCGPCSLNVQFPRTYHGNSYEHPIHTVELKNSLRNVRHGMLHNTVITQEGEPEEDAGT